MVYYLILQLLKLKFRILRSPVVGNIAVLLSLSFALGESTEGEQWGDERDEKRRQ